MYLTLQEELTAQIIIPLCEKHVINMYWGTDHMFSIDRVSVTVSEGTERGQSNDY
jgi:hypothetical protein